MTVRVETQKRCEDRIQSYLNSRSWRTLAVDKTTAPHRKAYTISLSGVSIATDVGAIAILSSLLIKPPSLELEDKISITPFSVDVKSTITKSDSARLPLLPLVSNHWQR